MLIVIIATWSRLIGFFLVMQQFSKLLMTTMEMMITGSYFLTILLIYLIIMSSIFMTLFQESTMSYASFPNTLRTLFDAVLGGYTRDIAPEAKALHDCMLVFHLYIANIFLLNYLVAMLGTVYGEMGEEGDFYYKYFKYKYIERYNIAFQDQDGFKELIVHPPPVNIFLIVLLPFLGNEERRKSVGHQYSKINFWCENVFFSIDQLLYELYLVPIVYIKIFVNLIKVGTIHHIPKMLAWALFGIFYLIWAVMFDMFNYYKILKDYKINNEKERKAVQKEESEKQDQIVIYNEIIDVMRSILYIVTKEDAKTREKKKGKVIQEEN